VSFTIGLAAGATMSSTGALAADASPDREISLTIYNKDIALVEHVRSISHRQAGSASNSRASRRRSFPRP
jgi:hypothetical protein